MLQKKVLEKISKVQEHNFEKFAQYQNDFGVLCFPNLCATVDNPYSHFMPNISSHITNIFAVLELQTVGLPATSLARLVSKNKRGDILKPDEVAKEYGLDLIIIDRIKIQRYNWGNRRLCCLMVNGTYNRVVGHYLFLLYNKQSLVSNISRGWQEIKYPKPKTKC